MSAASFRPAHGGYPTPRIPDEHAAWAEFAAGDRRCHFCGLPCLPEDHPATSKDRKHYAHFTCWYDDCLPTRLSRSTRE